MKRATLFVFALLCIGGIGLIVMKRAALATGHDAGRDGSAPGHRATRASAPADPSRALDGGAANGDGTSPGGDQDKPGDAGGVLFDGGILPEQVGDGPKSVTFGVVLVQYAGAEGAAPGSRTQDEARQLAQELAELAKTDFKAAVEKGDTGSITDAGRMFRGVLEPAPEYVLFSLDKDQVSAPVDTPRGFWIVKRNE